jgi:hypothetical protein
MTTTDNTDLFNPWVTEEEKNLEQGYAEICAAEDEGQHFSPYKVHGLLYDLDDARSKREWAQRLHPYMRPGDWTKFAGIVAGRLLPEGRYMEFIAALDPQTRAGLRDAFLVTEEMK